MDTLQITREAALKAHENAKSSGKELLENLFGKKVFIKDIRELLNDIHDVYKYHDTNEKSFMESCKGLTDDEIAYRQLKLIVAAYNQKEIPDYTNTSQRKFSAYFSLGSSSGRRFAYYCYVYWCTYSFVGARLDYLSLDNLKDAVSKFLDVYERFYTVKQ